MPRMQKAVLALAMAILFLLTSGCAEAPPDGQPSIWSGLIPPKPTAATTPTAEPTPTFVTPATPYPTSTGNVMPQPTFRNPPDSGPVADQYVLVYDEWLSFNSSRTEAFTYALAVPPMFVDFDVTPEMVTRSIVKLSSDGKKKETIEVTHVSENSWLEVTVRDQRGYIIAQDGFGRKYDVDTRKQVSVHSHGEYLIEITGSRIEAHVRVRVGGIGTSP